MVHYIVKFQTHINDEEMLNLDNKPEEHVNYELVKKMFFKSVSFDKNFEQKNKIFMSTPFSIKAVDMLSRIWSPGI